MRYFSLFSGVGGFELAINNVYERNVNGSQERGSQANTQGDKGQRLQSEEGKDISSKERPTSQRTPNLTDERPLCVGFSEIDKYAISVYQYHYKTHKPYGDITQIDWNTVPDFDLVVGGSPCQDLSVAGKQKGLSGARSGLFFEFVRCLKEKQPTNFIWENVKGALSSSSGWDFARVQIEFSEAGYDCEWQVLNAKDFGVPQNRERIFVVGHLRGKSEPKVFPIRTDGETTNKRFEGRVQSVASTLKSRDYASWRGNFINQINKPKHSNDRVYSDDGISPSLNTMQGGRRQPFVALTERRTEEAKKLRRLGIVKDTRSLKELVPREDGIANTVTTGDVKNQSLTDGTRIRRLTPLECERLMSWPDDWTKTGTTGEISDSQRYKQCGNGLVSKVVEEIVRRLYL